MIHGQCLWDKAAEPTAGDLYGDPLRDTSPWSIMPVRNPTIIFSAEPPRGFEPVGRISNEPNGWNDPMTDELGRQRDDLWGFAVGDRVRVKEPGGHYGLSGIVYGIGGCSMAKVSATCRVICPNVGFIATHRLGISGGGICKTVAKGQVTCPPSHLEHTD